jgi:hypothetical protein
MKKTFILWFVLLVFILLHIYSYAQTPKLNTVFYYSFGIVMDSKGNVFDRSGNLFIIDRSSSNNSYIRKLSPDCMVTTFCKHEWNPKTSQYEQAD